MGLDCSHDAFHGAYSAFTRWRHKIAQAAGYLVQPVIYGNGERWDTIMLEWHRYRQDVELMGEWEETPHDPLIVLFAHSDCEGVIKPAQAVPLADALEALLPRLREMEAEAPSAGHIAARGGLVGVTEKFIAGLRDAASKNEPVDFH